MSQACGLLAGEHVEVFDATTFEAKTSIASPDDSWILEDLPWITAPYIERCLRDYFDDDSTILSHLILKSVTAKGDNYGGVMVRVIVTYNRQTHGETTTSFVLKTQIWNELLSRTLKVYDIHNKEMDVYEQILPKIRKMLCEIGERGDMFPETIVVDRASDAIIFEDLLLKKYQVKNRLEGLNHEHILLGLEKIAKIHAASAVLYEQDKGIYDSLKSGMFTRRTNVYYTFFNSMWAMCAEAICKMPGYEKYGEKVKRIQKQMIESACRVYDRDDGDFHVLTHGDLWTTNLMYNYMDDGSLKDVVILDYQYAYHASPMLDFILFMYTSTSDEVRLNHDHYLQFYHEQLAETLKKLKYSKAIPTLFQMRQQYQKKSFLKLTSSFCMLPSMINDCGIDADFESLMMDDEKALRFKRKCMRNPKYQAILKKILPQFDQEGLLDPLE